MAAKVLNNVPYSALDKLLKLGWEEDIGSGDITSIATISEDQISTAVYIAKQKGIAAGLPLIDHLIKKVVPDLIHTPLISEGVEITPGMEMGKIRGPTRQILSIERILLNFLQHFCGVATKSYSYQMLTENSHTKILDTRKTLPGYRALDKYAVRIGKGTNHRFGLYDRVLIKDNHIHACGSVRKAVDRVTSAYGNKYIIETEVTSLEQFKSLKESQVTWVMLDNMTKDEMIEAIEWKGRNMPDIKLEASGNMDHAKVKDISDIGLDYISVGALTHSSDAIDITLKFTQSSRN